MTASGDAQVVTASAMLTGHALQLDGSGDDLHMAGVAAFQLGAASFTIDLELSTTATAGCIAATAGATNWRLEVNGSGTLDVIFDGGIYKTSSVAINDGNKHHIAVVRSGGSTCYLFVDGVQDGGTFSYGNSFTNTPTYFSIGSRYDGSINNAWAGKVGFFRMTPGVARWTAGFTVPTLGDIGAVYSSSAVCDVALGDGAATTAVFPVVVAEYLTIEDVGTGIWFARLADGVTVGASHGASVHAVESLAVGLSVAASHAAKMIFGETLVASISISSAAAAKLLATASISESVALHTAGLNAGDIDDAIETWCANLATEAHSRYAQYGFNSFASYGGKRYGCKSDGVFELGGDTDGADPIPWTVTLAETDFGMDALKRLPYVYIGARATGDLVLKVIEGPGSIHFFSIEMSGREGRAGRAKLAKGLSGRYWTIEIASDTERVELDAIEFFPVKVSRRI